jgi:hypothetical protein
MANHSNHPKKKKKKNKKKFSHVVDIERAAIEKARLKVRPPSEFLLSNTQLRYEFDHFFDNIDELCRMCHIVESLLNSPDKISIFNFTEKYLRLRRSVEIMELNHKDIHEIESEVYPEQEPRALRSIDWCRDIIQFDLLTYESPVSTTDEFSEWKSCVNEVQDTTTLLCNPRSVRFIPDTIFRRLKILEQRRLTRLAKSEPILTSSQLTSSSDIVNDSTAEIVNDSIVIDSQQSPLTSSPDIVIDSN